MKKTLSILIILLVLSSCKEEAIEKPDRLIAKEDMLNIMYDLSLLEAIKYENLTSLEIPKINPSEYIYKKYKIDSLQFVQSNKYYASNYTEYKDMFDQIGKRIEQDKSRIEMLIKVEKKKKSKVVSMKTPLTAAITAIDSLKTQKKQPFKFTNSKWPLYTDEYLKIPFLKRF